MNALEFMEEGVLTTIIGMGVVFAVLVILSLCIRILNSAVDTAGRKKTGGKKISGPETPVLTPPGPPSVESEVQAERGVTPALAAVITASICVLTGKAAEEFKFTSIKPVSGNRSAWALTGAADLMATRERYIERGNK